MSIRSLLSAAWGKILILGLVILLLSILGLGLARARAGPVSSGPAPDFSLTTYSGQQIQLSALKGQVVVVNFWASWCGPCRTEAPILEAAWRRYRDDGVVFIGVNWVDTESEAKKFLEDFGITYPNGPDVGTEIAQAYQIEGIPETFFIDRQGNVAAVHTGVINSDLLREQVERLLQDQ